MNRKVGVFLLILFVIVAGLVSYRLLKNKEKQSSNQKGDGSGRTEAKVYGMVVSGKPFSDFLSLTGGIEANEIVDLRAEISGLVESLNFEEGGSVGGGQVLVKINDSELRAQLEQAQTRSNLAQENERRARLLLEKEAISQEEYEIASADYRTAKSQIQLIQAQLNKTLIKAPFAGRIGLRSISKGSYITPTTAIAQLVNLSRIKLQFSIPEKYAVKVRIGEQVRFTVQGSDEVFVAKIYALEPLIEESTRTLRVRAIADNGNNRLIPGSFANVTFPLETISDGLLVPTEALIPIQNGKKLFLKKNGKAKETLVETGGRTDSVVLITKGIADGDTVLTSGVMSLRDGSPVKVTLR
ncbi:efflux RND transporter periplasmic adaptor subunit [Sphingobacterium tabacisoli]|uniref:Efflux RND transporter periplasmic adaptor subunit n=1 Tax=Sphingobacterium tabacisoli TaxID=2044855 RepID=A0ABW5L7Y5_9SPHI|nr:efflux RND transporter periplasmic adaptor subunit [Sphingobacterium tabacisoli]